MRKLRFIQADVFAETPFGGNPVVVIPDAVGLSAEDMQDVARGMEPVETAFVKPPQTTEADFSVRFFTASARVPFSGHPALGTAYVLAKEGRFELIEPITQVIAETEIGQLPIDLYLDGDEIHQVVLTEKRPQFGGPFEALGELAAGLNIPIDDLLEVSLPIQRVSTGLAALVVPLDSLAAVQDVLPHQAVLDQICTLSETDCIIVFSTETMQRDATAHVRVFAPPLGIEEDPATGSANGALGAYLVRHQIIPAQGVAEIHCEQGYEIGRPSLVHVTVDTTSDDLSVRVGGRVLRSVDGHIFF